MDVSYGWDHQKSRNRSTDRNERKRETHISPSIFRKLKKHLEKLCNTARGRELPECLDGSIFGAGGGGSPSATSAPDYYFNLTTTTAATASAGAPSNLPSPLDALCNSAVADGIGVSGNATLAACNNSLGVYNGRSYSILPFDYLLKTLGFGECPSSLQLNSTRPGQVSYASTLTALKME